MKVGRNDPCPCGSGKKYKKCCLPGDQKAAYRRNLQTQGEGTFVSAEKQAAAPHLQTKVSFPAPPRPPEQPKPPPDPHMEAIETRWKEFEKQDYEGRIALFLKTLEEKELMDDQLAFDMLDQLYLATSQHNERDRFATLIAALRERLPEVYATNAVYFLSWLLSNALAASQQETLPALTRELAAYAGKDIDMVNRVIDQLEYHGQLDLLREITRIGLADVKASHDIMPHGKYEFAERGGDYEIFDYLLHTPDPRGDDPSLLDRLGFYVEDLRTEKLIRYIEHVSDKKSQTWQVNDFAIQPSTKKSAFSDDDEDVEDEEKTEPLDPGKENLYYLSIEFLGYLHREEKVPYTRGEQARQGLVGYLVERAEGELEPRPGLLEDRRSWERRRPARQRPPSHPLCPDRGTLDRYLASLLDFLSAQYFKVCALFTLLPAWLRFLEQRQLLSAEQRQKCLRELEGLHATLLKAMETAVVRSEDPTLVQDLKAWPKELEKAVPTHALPEEKPRAGSSG